MDQVVHLSFGDVAGHEDATQLVADLVIHGWDMGSTRSARTRRWTPSW